MVVSSMQDDTWPDEMASGDKSWQDTMDIPKRFLLSNRPNLCFHRQKEGENYEKVIYYYLRDTYCGNRSTCIRRHSNYQSSSTNIPDFEVHVEIPQSFWDKWFADHPITIPKSTEPMEPVETAPEETEPKKTELSVLVITNAHYTHGKAIYIHSNLRIEWTEVEGAESYEVLITLANGETITYMETDTEVYDTKVGCPQSYSGENGHIAYVKVRAIAGNVVSEWSEQDTISCNALHF